MRKIFQASILVILYLFLSACGEAARTTPLPVAATTTPLPSPAVVTPTFLPSQTPSATIEVTPTQAYVHPTLIPTIDPTRVPELLKQGLSIQTLEGVNGSRIQQITGWKHGYGGGYMSYWGDFCNGYYWLDGSHLLLYPAAGQQITSGYGGVGVDVNVVPQPAVINLKSGNIWLPPINTASTSDCHRVYWSQELGILITTEVHGESSTVATYTKDGYRLSSYPGQLLDVSPRGTKVLISEDTLIDLKTDKTIKLNWNLEDYYEPILSSLYWTYPDETRVYRCCYFYADLTTGISHRFQRFAFRDTQGNHLDPSGLWFHQGEWVRDNQYFLVSWMVVDDGPVKYLPMFDPDTKLFYDVWKMAGISPDWEWLENEVSPDGNYAWMAGWGGSYLVNLTTFESQYYPYQDPYTYTDVNWSADSKFVWLQTYVSDKRPTEFQIFSLSDKKLSPPPVIPLEESDHWWHPTDTVVVYPSADKDTLVFLDVSAMSYRELPFTLQKYPRSYGNVVWNRVVWNPNGNKLALVKEDGSLWQVDYPTLENLEQVTPSLPDIQAVDWSPNGNSISFISGSDIYIVDTMK